MAAVVIANSAVAQKEERIKALEASVKRLETKIEAPQGSSDFRVYWKDGLHFESADKMFTGKFGGRIHLDSAWMSGDDGINAGPGKMVDGVEFRRARLYVSGMLYERIEYKAQYDFAGGDADFKDVYLGVTKIPVVGNLRAGQFKEPFGLEELTSSNYITFLERSLTETFVPSRNTGIMLHNHELDEKLTWAIGVFKDTDSYGNRKSDGEGNVTARVTGLPYYEEDGEKLVHVGLAGSYRSPNGGMVQYEQRPEAHLAPVFVDTGAFAADHATLIGAELAGVMGPASLQAEYMWADVDTPGGGGNASFGAFYVMGSFFVTGEHRPYKRSNGTFSRVKPKHRFGSDEGSGALEVALRYSQADLNDGPINGGKLDDVTAAVNWYLNRNTRVMTNYIHSDLDTVGNANSFLIRFQIDF